MLTKSIKLVLLGMIVISCNNNQMNSDYFTKYVEGEVIIRAENNHPIGMIKIADVFDSDDHIESPSRAILYKYEKDNAEFDLNDTVWFKIEIENNLQFACSIDTSKPTQSLASKEELYHMIKKFDINLHNADPHREGPQHIRKHIIPTSRITSSDPNISGYKIVDPTDPTNEKVYAILENQSFYANTFYYMYVTNETIPNDLEEHLDVTDYVYELSQTHDHTH